MASQQHINWQGRMLGRYQLLQLAGWGGIGEVWLADDTQLRRRVAIKLLPAVLANDNSYLQDFKYESRAIAALEHPHILPVHDFGEQVTGDEVTTYLVMPYITGGSLRDRIHSITGPLPTDQALSMLKQAAEAIDYAHSQHVLHRDIKPGNMLLQDGWLLLADFGLAKLLLSSTYRSRTHAGAGTPEYMAPEQAMGKAEVASDRYSLAIIAYQIFTGQLPFQGETPYATLIKQVQDTPPSPRQHNPNIPQMVEDTLLQGLAKRPEERPVSCLTFVNALERGWNIEQQLLLADPDATVLAPWSKRLQANVDVQRRQKRPILSAPLLMPLPHEQAGQLTDVEMVQKTTPETLMYMPTIASVPSQLNMVAIEQQEIPETPVLDQREGRIGRRALLIGGAAVAAAAVASSIALPALLHHPSSVAKLPFIPGPKHLIPGIPVLNLTGHTDEVSNVIWDPTGRYIATAGQDTHVLLWDISTALQHNPSGFQTLSTPIKSWKFAGEIESSSLCWSTDGRSLVVCVGGDDANKVYLINPFDKNMTPITYTDTNADSNNLPYYGELSWKPNTDTFAVVQSIAPTVQINTWKRGETQTLSGKFKYEEQGQSISGSVIAWSPDGSMLASDTDHFEMVVWDTKTARVKRVIHLPDRTQGKSTLVLREAIVWSPVESNTLLISDIDVVTLWNVQQNKLLSMLGTDDPHALAPPSKPTGFNWFPNTLGISWSPNGRYVVGAYGRTAKMCLWDLHNQKPNIKKGVHIQDAFIPASSSVGGHNGIIIDNAWSPDGRYLATASADKTVLIWKMDAS